MHKLSSHEFNKIPILAFARDAVPDLFPLHASQMKYCVTVLEIMPEISF